MQQVSIKEAKFLDTSFVFDYTKPYWSIKATESSRYISVALYRDGKIVELEDSKDVVKTYSKFRK